MTDESRPETPETTPAAGPADPGPAAAEPAASASPASEPAADDAGWSAGKWAGAWINTIVMVFLAVAILVGINYLSYRRNVRYDMTANQEYRISDRTRTIVGGLATDVDIYTVFLTPAWQLSYEDGDARRRLESVLAEFRNCSPRIRVSALSFGMDQLKLKGLAKEMNLKAGLTDLSVIVKVGSRSKSIELSKMYEMSYAGRIGRINAFNAEGMLVAAILELTEAKPPVVYFTQGHGTLEGKLERSGREDSSSLFWIVNRIKDRENVEKKTINLLAAPTIPEDARVLVIHRPAVPYGTREVLALRDFLARGGRLIVMADTLDAKGGFVETGLEGLLAEWGVRFGRNVIVGLIQTPMGLAPLNTPIVQGPDYGSHPIVAKLKEEGLPCRLGLSRTVDKVDEADSRLEVTPLMTLTEKGWWGETSGAQIATGRVRQDPEDRVGELPLAQVVKAPVGDDLKNRISRETRLVVFGNASFATDKEVGELGNEDLFVNALLWLIDREQNIGIGAKSIADRRVTLNAGQQAMFFWVGIVFLPILAVLLGLGLWIVRRT